MSLLRTRRKQNEQNNKLPRNNNHRGGDVFLLDGAEGTRKITGQNAADGFLELAGGAKKKEIGCDSYYGITLVEPGWYNIIKSETDLHNREVTTNTFGMFLNIKKGTNIEMSEHHIVGIFSNRRGFVFEDVLNISSSKNIDKVRVYTLLNSAGTSYRIYVDIHKTTNNQISLNFDILFPGSSVPVSYKFIKANAEKVPDDVESTSLYEHTFKANSWLDGPDAWPLT